MRKLCFLAVAALILLSACHNAKPSFVRVEDGRFVSDDNYPSYFAGTNFWYGAILGSEGQGGDRERLAKELDFLKESGMVNLRVLVGGDGPDGVQQRICPTLQKAPGVYNDTIFWGLDYLLAELAKRDMKAVLYINNSWEWSGGYGMYLEWAGEGEAVLPSVVGYQEYIKSVSRFITCDKAKELFANHVKHVVSRTNTVTGKPYKDDPAIFSWQIGNEPRCFSHDPVNQQMFADWMWETAALIKSIDPNHMVSSGSEGYHGCEQNFDLFEKIHSCPDIDYMNIHIWPYNWSWVRETTLATNLDKAIANTDAYIDAHLEIAARHGKPVVLEEFGFPRDDFQFAKGSPTTCRDKYYEHVLQRIVESAKEGGLFAGLNFWGWGGFAEQSETNTYWQPGDDYCGDPAQEQQGLNSVYASDESTIQIITNAAKEMDEAQKPTAYFHLENDGLYSKEQPQVLKATVSSRQEMRAELVMNLSTDLRLPVKAFPRRVKLNKGDTELKYKLSLTPGFYEAVLEVVEADGTRRELARTNIGCELEKIESPQDKQEDFDEFWSQTLAQLTATAPEYKLTLLKEHSNDVRRTYRVDMTGFGGEPTCGILVEPVAEGCYETVVHYMGYGAEIWYPKPSDNPERVDFILCNRNQSLNRKPGEDNYWLTRGLESKETYYYRGVFADAVRAIDFVCSRKNVDQDRLFAEGGSQGGAITLVAAALDHRLDAIAPSVPFLGDYKDYFQIVEWPGNWLLEAAVQKGISEEDLYTTLSYFDVKNFTDRIQCPVLMGFGLQDVTCPPHTNFAGYNMIKAPKRWICYPHSGHSLWNVPEWPHEVEAWFDKYSKPQPDGSLPWQVAQWLGIGWNLGNHFDGFSEGVAGENAWGNPSVTRQTFKKLKEIGFTTVRIPVTWLGHFGDAPQYGIDSDWLNRLYEVVGFAEEAGLNAIINIHHDGAESKFWLDVVNAAKDPDFHQGVISQLTAMWTQIAERFQDKGDFLMFEGFNEVHDGKWGGGANRTDGGKQYACVNDWNQAFVNAVRATGGNNATRYLGVAAYCTNADLAIDSFVMPKDVVEGKLVLSVHHYNPTEYTLTAKYSQWGHTADAAKKLPGDNEGEIRGIFERIYANFISKGIPVYMGEFGCVNRATPLEQQFQQYYLKYYARLAKIYGVPCIIWDNGAKGAGNERHAFIDHATGEYASEEAKAAIEALIESYNSDMSLNEVYKSAPENK